MSLLLLLAGCVEVDGVGPEAVASDPAARAFVAAETGWRADNPALGVAARFGAGPAVFAEGAARFSLGADAQDAPWAPGACASTGETLPDGACLPRMERDLGGMVEWWENRADAWEHGFDVASGGDALAIDVHVAGGRPVAAGEAVHVRVPGGGGYTYANLVVTDATGRVLDARMDVVGDVIRLHADTSDAAWPVRVDPSLTPGSWIAAPVYYKQFGTYVAHLGDVNGDGFDDAGMYATDGKLYVYHGGADGLAATPASSVTISARPNPAGDVNGDGYADLVTAATAGSVSVYHGSPGGFSSTAAVTFTPSGYSSLSALGIGDTNGDGYDDIVVARPSMSYDYSSEGRYWIHRGGPSGISSTAAWAATGGQRYAYAGTGLAGGDWNGDGLADLAVGAPLYDAGETDEGVVLVYFGSTGTMSTTPAVTIEANDAGAYFGEGLHNLGDADGDGDDELVVTAPLYDATSPRGYVTVQRGSASGPPATPDQVVRHPGYSSFGYYVAGAGDVNGDGRADLVVGSPSSTTVESGDGAFAVWFSDATGYDRAPDVFLHGGSSSEDLGTSLAGGGDFDADGYDDVLAGAPGLNLGSSSDTGRVYLLYGTAEEIRAAKTWSEAISAPSGSASTAYFGVAVSGAGDLDGDGFDEVVLGASGSRKAYAYHGSADGLLAVPTTTFSGTSGFGGGPAAPGDFDGDGYGDVLVGSSSWSNPDNYEGIARVYEGSALGASATPAWAVEGGQVSAYFGVALAVGDFDRDGYDDAVVGASGYDLGHTNEGIVYLYEGSATGLSTTPAWFWDADQAGAAAGAALAVGDLDGDGYPDLAVGASSHDGSFSDEGAVHVFFGSAAGLGAAPGWTGTGGQTRAGAGAAVVVPGDMNGDGYDDLVVGAPGYDGAGANEGGVLFWYGGPDGPAATPDAVWTSGQADADVGYAIAGGDVDGDGLGDVVVGGYDYRSSVVYDGRAWIFRGAEGGVDTTDAYWLTTWDAFAEFGFSVGLADIDADGRDEVFVGAIYAGDSGRVYVWDLDDGDGDGDFDITDCDADDASVGAGVAERCDGVDNDCDGAIDEEIPTWHADADGDGYGAPAVVVESCTAPSGYVADATDCDDADAATHPGAAEACDGADDDCDGAVDESDPGQPAWYPDADADGYGGDAGVVYACTAPAGATATGGDCDDADGDVSPSASERCDGEDDDCDGAVDEDPVDAPTWFLDGDADGWGGDGAVDACDAPPGWVADAGDCDDTDGTAFPGAAERCDEADDDCDGVVDEGVTTTFYGDLDGDGHGGSALTTAACTAPGGFTSAADDCDDGDATVFPGAAEACDGADDDCDGTVDEGVTTTYYRDADGDGHGALGATTAACAPPAGYAATALDCDDGAATVHPGAPELCNALDDDCDGEIDPADASGAPTWYVDADGDGYGADATARRACEAPAGAVAAGGDCDDGDAAVSPGAAETPYDGVDQDCAGDDDFDADGDGHASDAFDGADCDDTDAAVFPGADEVWYDGVDQDCDAGDDYDADGDGQASAGHGGADCDDADAEVYDGAPDEPYDGVVTDCANADDFDADGDGHAAIGHGDDCDDARSDVHPGAAEDWYDGVDQDCDGVDDDQDGDGFALLYDCADRDPAVHPEATEIPGNGVDDDCRDGDAEADDAGKPEGCACDGGGAGLPVWAFLLLPGLLARRR